MTEEEFFNIIALHKDKYCNDYENLIRFKFVGHSYAYCPISLVYIVKTGKETYNMAYKRRADELSLDKNFAYNIACASDGFINSNMVKEYLIKLRAVIGLP